MKWILRAKSRVWLKLQKSTNTIRKLHKLIFDSELADRKNREATAKIHRFDNWTTLGRLHCQTKKEFTEVDFISIAKILCIDYSGVKSTIVERIYGYLHNLTLLEISEGDDDDDNDDKGKKEEKEVKKEVQEVRKELKEVKKDMKKNVKKGVH